MQQCKDTYLTTGKILAAMILKAKIRYKVTVYEDDFKENTTFQYICYFILTARSTDKGICTSDASGVNKVRFE